MRVLVWIVCVATGALLMACSDDSTRPKGESSPRTAQTSNDSSEPERSAVDVLTPPYGLDYVGLGRVAVLVPSGMVAKATECSRRTAKLGWCVELTTKRGASGKNPVLTVTIKPYDQGLSDWYSLEPLSNGSGLEAFAGDPCPKHAFCVARGQMLTVPSEGFSLVAVGGGKAQARIRDLVRSVTLVPDGYTTVPPVPRGMETEDAVDLLAAAGFQVDAPTPSAAYYAWDTTPAAGTVVPEGSTVTVHVGDG